VRRSHGAGARSVGIVLILVLSTALAFLSGAGSASLGTHAETRSVLVGGPSLLAEAHASAARGNGPGGVSNRPQGAVPSTGPNETFGIAMTYDAADGYVLAVSLNATAGPGNNSYGPNELTWKFAAGNWTRISTTGQVPATLGPGLVYDARDGYVLLYGGRLMSTLPAPLTNQTWSYLAGTWTNLSRNGTTVPTAVDLPNLVFDAYDDYVLLYDEVDLSGGLWTTWSYAAGNWTNLTGTAGVAPAAAFGGMAYDARDQCVVYFGGETLSDELTNATWTFRGGAWTNVSASVVNAPGGRIAFGMTYDSARQEILLYGGLVQLLDFNLTEYGTDTWAYANGTWTQLSTNGSVYNPQAWNPPQLNMVYDPADNETVLFGANLSASNPTAVTWTFSTSTWTVAAPVFAPAGRDTDTGRAITLEVTQPVGAGEFTYTYSGLPTGCDSQNVSSLVCVPSAVGSFDVRVTIAGAGGFAAGSATTIVVHPAPAILGFAPSDANGEVGLSIAFAVTAVNGTGPLAYAYADLPSGCQSTNAAMLACVPTVAGVYPVTARVTDALGVVVQADTLLTVVPALSMVGVTPNHVALDVGQSLVLESDLGGGLGPFQFGYVGLPSGCAPVPVDNLSCRPDATGRFPVLVTATDSLGGAAAGGTSIVVNSLPTVESLAASRNSVPTGGSVQLTTTVAGGTVPFQYQFTGLPSGCAWNGGAVVSCNATPDGRYTVSVEATDATGASANGSTTFVVGPATNLGHPPSQTSAGLGSFLSEFEWGLAVGSVVIAIAAIVGVNRIRLARQGERIVRDLRDADPAVAAGAPDATPAAEDRPTRPT
jgi:hypothetical protein